MLLRRLLLLHIISRIPLGRLDLARMKINSMEENYQRGLGYSIFDELERGHCTNGNRFQSCT